MARHFDAPPYMTPADVAEHLTCTARYVRYLAQTRRLGALKLGRDWRISPASLAEYKRAHSTEPEPAVNQPGHRHPVVDDVVQPAVELDGPYMAVVKGPVPWRLEVP